ncbi:MAG: hypothetical protein PHR77_19580 [Kiritimatiellae bacterium]|nr:hypothetical protein [Kiritimatiellia bacterium]MDD5520492.1 hypothetical protein [Kiritimatiellia bacterium]
MQCLRAVACFVTLCIIGYFCTVTSAQEDINPVPRQVLETKKLHEWTFQTGTTGCRALNDCTVTAVNGVLKIQSTGNDPYLVMPQFRVEGPLSIRLRARCTSGGDGQFFWTTTQSPNMDEERSRHFKLIHDCQWHDYIVSLDITGMLVDLRFDPGSAPGVVEVEKMELVQEILHPLEIGSVHNDGHSIELLLKNHSNQPVNATVGSQKITVAASNAQKVLFQAAGKVPFETAEIVVQPENLPALRRQVFIADMAAGGEWVTRKSGQLTLHVARDGTGARVELNGKLVAFIAPLVSRDGSVPGLKLKETRSALCFTGTGIKTVVKLHNDEITVAIESDVPCEGPVLRALGPLEQGILAGVEYLGKGEKSSSTLDIETEEHIRFMPDPLKVTMPLMAFVTDRVCAAMTWNDMLLQPVYATPNFLDGTEGHRAALRGKKIEATILVRQPMRVEDAILWVVKKRGLPPLPKPPRDRKAQMEMCLKTLSSPPLKTDAGWGHCAEPKWTRHPFADMASTVWRISGQAPQFPKLVPGGAHIRNDTIYFVTGRAEEWLNLRTGEVKRILTEQKPDGSFRYNGKYQRGHFEDTASGYCARPAMTLLEYVHFTGDAEALAAGVKALEFMKRFHTPRGAQTWECPLHTPDILGSAYLVNAYVRGYELTGNREYLDCARRWAISGLPFVYQWDRYPVMVYATTPVLGATAWRAPNWIGLPVQWCGHVYAYALTMLAHHDGTIDWKHVAEGIQISAEQQQQPDGEYAGCLPDSFTIAEQRRNGPFINPSALVNLRLVLDGELDSLAVAMDGKRRVVAPFPVTIRGDTAVIRAKAGVSYQVLVDGKNILDVQSKGKDIVQMK